MKKFVLGLLFTALIIPSASVTARQDRSVPHIRYNEGPRDYHDQRADDDRRDQSRSNRGRHRGHQKRAGWREYNRYDHNRHDPRYGNYHADRYYRNGDYYQDRRLNNRDRIYRGSNDRYYCRRSDGTTGLIIGVAGGSLLGRSIARNGSKTLGTILGGVGGGLIGRSIDRGGVRCN